MNTTTNTGATNKRLGHLLRDIIEGKLDITYSPSQRKGLSVKKYREWSAHEKHELIRTVLAWRPMPEIYIITGDVNLATARYTEIVVDGKQRLLTLLAYISGNLALPDDIPPYQALEAQAQLDFREYVVVVRDLGRITLDEAHSILARFQTH